MTTYRPISEQFLQPSQHSCALRSQLGQPSPTSSRQLQHRVSPSLLEPRLRLSVTPSQLGHSLRATAPPPSRSPRKTSAKTSALGFFPNIAEETKKRQRFFVTTTREQAQSPKTSKSNNNQVTPTIAAERGDIAKNRKKCLGAPGYSRAVHRSHRLCLRENDCARPFSVRLRTRPESLSDSPPTGNNRAKTAS